MIDVLYKFQKVVGSNRNCSIVSQRMEVLMRVLEHSLFQYERDEWRFVVDEREWRYRAGRYSQDLKHFGWFCETKFMCA
jgi:hypothetical protein